MNPLVIFLVLGGILLVFAIFNWRARFRAHKEDQQEDAREAAARRERLGPDYKTGSGKPEPEMALYEPPDDYLGESIDPELSMEQVDAALDRRAQLMQD